MTAGASPGLVPMSAIRKLRCHAHRKEGQWQAVCIDLDVGATGDPLPAVMASLDEAISLYLECVEEEAEPDRRRLLARRSPWPVRFGHWARRQWARVSGGDEFTCWIALPG